MTQLFPALYSDHMRLIQVLISSLHLVPSRSMIGFVIKWALFLAKLRQAEHHNYRDRTTCMHRNRNPCNYLFIVKMASDMNRERPTTQGRRCAIWRPCLQRISSILDINVKLTLVKTRYPMTSIT